MPVDDKTADATAPTTQFVDETAETMRDGARESREVANVADRYRLGSTLGRGGMGEVVLAFDAQIGREVAVKQIRDRSPQARARFVREARIQGRLEHPSIVPVHELRVDATGNPYFVMKRLTGTTLANIVAPASPIDRFSRNSLLRAFADVCLAIEFAHTRGVIHRDLKPANIMLGDFGEVYIIDWGIAHVTPDAGIRIARDVDSSDPTSSASPADASDLEAGDTEAGTILGTVGYMSPEQLSGQPIDARADVYALGCILFEILARRPLHAAAVAAVLGEYDARPSQLQPDVAPELDAICVAATMPEHGTRIASARELAERVQRYLDGDRDVALRRRLADDHVAAAMKALTLGADIERRAAMQHATTALALDPTTVGAAELLGRLMLEPPREIPGEVDAELTAIDESAMRAHARHGVGALLACFAFVPLMAWIGVRGAWLAAISAVIAANVGISFVMSRLRGPVTPVQAWIGIAAGSALVLVLSRSFTPFLVAPAFAIGMMLAFAQHPRFGSMWLLATAMAGAVLAPWFGEQLGLVPMTSSEVNGALVLRPPSAVMDVGAFEVTFAVFITVTIAVVGIIARTMARTERSARQTALVQAWHLRQLVVSDVSR